MHFIAIKSLFKKIFKNQQRELHLYLSDEKVCNCEPSKKYLKINNQDITFSSPDYALFRGSEK